MNSTNKKIEINNVKLGTEKISKLLISNSLPLIIGMVLNGFYFIEDIIFTSWIVGAKAISGLVIVFPIQMLIISIGSMIGIGTATFVSFELGKGNKNQASLIIKNSILFTTIISIILTLLLMIFKSNIIYLFGASKEIFSYADDYYLWLVPGTIFVLIGFLEANTIRAEGNAKLSGISMILGIILNLIFNSVFMIIFKMGVAGAALGTVVSRLIVMILLTLYYSLKKSIVDIFTKVWVLSFLLFKKVIFSGIGSFLNQFSSAVLVLVVNLSLKYYGSINDLSIFGVLNGIYNFIAMPFFGYALGFQTIVGYNFGAKKHERIKESIQYSLLYTVILGIFLFIFLVLKSKLIMSFFTNDIELIENGFRPLKIMMILVPIIGLHTLSYFYFIAIHKPIIALIISLFRQIIFLLPFILILPIFLGKMGLWISFPIADFLSAFIGFLLVIKSFYKDLNI